MSENTQDKVAEPVRPTKVKIVQIMFDPYDQELLGLGDDGVVYQQDCHTGLWFVRVPPPEAWRD